MMWTVYEIILNLYKGFLYTRFITRMLGKKTSERWSFIVCALLTAAGFCCYIKLAGPIWWDIWVYIFIISYSVIFLNGTLLQKLFWNLILLAMSPETIGIAHLISYRLLGTDTADLMQTGIPGIISSLSFNVSLWLIPIILIFKEKNDTIQPSRFLLITVFLCLALIDSFFKLINQVELSIGIMTLTTYHFLVKYTRIEQEYYLQKEILNGSEKQIDEIKEIYGSTLKLRHDMRAFVKDVQEMAERGEAGKVSRYLSEMEKEVLPLYSTGNQALDSVLMVKAAKIQAQGIEFRGTNLHYTGGMNIKDSMLCSLVSNMLDNAIEALMERKDRTGERYIFLGFNYSLAGLMIICENPLLGIPPKMVKKSFFSKKTEPCHGLGISIMEKIAHDAGGRLEVALYEDTFRVLALIPPSNE